MVLRLGRDVALVLENEDLVLKEGFLYDMEIIIWWLQSQSGCPIYSLGTMKETYHRRLPILRVFSLERCTI
jgi:hypothetical protein